MADLVMLERYLNICEEYDIDKRNAFKAGLKKREPKRPRLNEPESFRIDELQEKARLTRERVQKWLNIDSQSEDVKLSYGPGEDVNTLKQLVIDWLSVSEES